MTIHQRKEHLVQLGKFLSQFTQKGIGLDPALTPNEPHFSNLRSQIELAIHYNGWFTRENILFSLKQWTNALKKENLDSWLSPYELEEQPIKTIGIIMAGNIPLVGFHDLICVLLAGHRALIKQSSNDQRLLPVIAQYLISLDENYKDRIHFTENRMTGFDAVIATGSNNTARYFEYYFANKPSIIRKNRNSVAILTGHETKEQLEALGDDIFRYFGLGCRNVSKLFVPVNYDFDDFYKAMAPWQDLMNHAKYANNYDYNKAVYLMSNFKFLDNGFLVLREAKEYGSPIATLFYQTYKGEDELQSILTENKDNLQCIVSSHMHEDHVSFGNTQIPGLEDYADNVDTLKFLQGL